MSLKLVSVEGQTIPDVSLADELTNFVDNLEEDAVGAITALIGAPLFVYLLRRGTSAV